MNRRTFLASSAASAAALGAAQLAHASPLPLHDSTEPHMPHAVTRKILIAGGGFNAAFIKYMAELTGKPRPRILYLPTAAGDAESAIIRFYTQCAGLNVVPSHQISFIASTSQTRGWDEVLFNVDGIVCSGGNTLNQQAIWRAQGIDTVLRQAWEQGIVLGGASAGSLCWFEEGTTDSRPKVLSIVKCLGFLPGSHSPHYDAEPGRRPLYQKLIASGEMKPGWACDNDAGIYFEGTEAKRFVHARAAAKVYYVSAAGGVASERAYEPELITA